MTRIVIIGGGPAGYEAALVAAAAARGRRRHRRRLRRHRRRLRAVTTACRPRRSSPPTGVRTELRRAPDLGFDLELEDAKTSSCRRSTTASRALAMAQSADIARPRLQREGVTLIAGPRRARRRAVPGMAAHTVKVTARRRRGQRMLDGRRRADRHRRQPARAARRRARRRAHPELAPALRPRPSCPSTWSSSAPASPAPSSSTPTPSWASRVTRGGQPRPDPAARGRRRRRGAARTCSPSAAWQIAQEGPGASRCAATDDGVVVTLTDGRTVERQPRADDRRLGAQHRRAGAGAGRHRHSGRADSSRSTGCRAPPVPGIYAAGDCTGLLHARLGGRHAGPHRDVARAGRGRHADPAASTVAAAVFTRPEIADGRRAASARSTPARCPRARSCCR